MYSYSYFKHPLQFNFDARTSRGEIKTHDAFYIKVWKASLDKRFGIGEASPLIGLSIDATENFEEKLIEVLALLNNGEKKDQIDLSQLPAIQFALETAHADLHNGGERMPYLEQSKNFQPIKINGLVWMSDIETMIDSFQKKVNQGYDVMKLKIGAHDFDSECRMLERLRKQYLPSTIQIRLDANGAFHPDDAQIKLKELKRFEIHSIEQPIQPGQWEEMAEICAQSPIAIALDEELIGLNPYSKAEILLTKICPHYLILKPTLIGGCKSANEWIKRAEKRNIGWWATSALESNIGLNAIAQWVSTHPIQLAQGLGTGALYKNNIASPLDLSRGKLSYNLHQNWEIPTF